MLEHVFICLFLLFVLFLADQRGERVSLFLSSTTIFGNTRMSRFRKNRCEKKVFRSLCFCLRSALPGWDFSVSRQKHCVFLPENDDFSTFLYTFCPFFYPLVLMFVFTIFHVPSDLFGIFDSFFHV